jgi:hypothetical protein
MTPDGSRFDVGAALLIGAFWVVPAGLLRLSQVRVKHAALVSVLAFGCGLVSWLGPNRR